MYKCVFIFDFAIFYFLIILDNMILMVNISSQTFHKGEINREVFTKVI